MQEGLELRGVEIWQKERRLLKLDLHIGPGEIVTIMAPSGAGKSSLLEYVCGLLPDGLQGRGEIWLDGKQIDMLAPHARFIGLLFQDALLFPFLSVAENLAFGLRGKISRQERQNRIALALKKAGLEGFGSREPATLSGGERARIALMRTLLAQPKALLLDEPFSKLDAPLRASFRASVFDEARARQLPVLLVSHDIADAEASGGRVIEMD